MKLNRRRTAPEKNESYGPFVPGIPQANGYDDLSLANVIGHANGLPRRKPRAKRLLKSDFPKRLAAELSGEISRIAADAFAALAERKLKRSFVGTSLKHARQRDKDHSGRANARAAETD